MRRIFKLLRTNCISQMCRGAVRALIGRRHNNWTCLKCSLKTWTHQQCHRFTLVKNVLKHSSPFSCQHMRVLFVLYVINKYINICYIYVQPHNMFDSVTVITVHRGFFFSLFSHCRIFKSFFLRQHLPRLILKYEGSNLNTEFIYCSLCMNEAAAENNLHIWLFFCFVFFSFLLRNMPWLRHDSNIYQVNVVVFPPHSHTPCGFTSLKFTHSSFMFPGIMELLIYWLIVK